MPSAALRYCAQPGCPEKSTAARCPQHDLTHGGWHRPGQAPAKRITGRRLQALRWQMFANEPFCRLCKVQLSAIRDHIIPLAEGGQDTPENTQPLCQDCSDAKTWGEAHRGRLRTTGG